MYTYFFTGLILGIFIGVFLGARMMVKLGRSYVDGTMDPWLKRKLFHDEKPDG